MTEPHHERDNAATKLAWVRSQIRLYEEEILRDLRGDETMEW